LRKKTYSLPNAVVDWPLQREQASCYPSLQETMQTESHTLGFLWTCEAPPLKLTQIHLLHIEPPLRLSSCCLHSSMALVKVTSEVNFEESIDLDPIGDSFFRHHFLHALLHYSLSIQYLKQLPEFILLNVVPTLN